MEFLLGPIAELVFASGHMKSLFIAYHNPIEKWFTVVAQNKRRQHFKTTTFFSRQLMRRPLTKLFHLSICFKCLMTIEWSTLSSSATSHVVVRGSVSMMALNCHCQIPMVGHSAPHLQRYHLLCKIS